MTLEYQISVGCDKLNSYNSRKVVCCVFTGILLPTLSLYDFCVCLYHLCHQVAAPSFIWAKCTTEAKINPNSEATDTSNVLKVRTKLSQLQLLQLTPWNEFLMSLILHVINTGLAVLKHTLKRNELIQINSDPRSVVSNWNCSHNWLTHTHTKHIHTRTKWIRSRSLLLKSATYHLSLTRSLQWTGGPYEGGEIMSALLEGENNGSELEPLISEPNRTFVVIFLIFSVLFSLIFLSKTV